MKNIKISPKFIELVRTNGKRLLCGAVAFFVLAIPHIGVAETANSDYTATERIIESYNYYNTEEVEFIVDGESVKVTLDLDNPELSKEEIKDVLDSLNELKPMSEFPSFFLISHWEKSENYKAVKKESNDKREYKRTISCFRANENYKSEDFKNDIEKIATRFKEDGEKYFDIVGTREEYVILTPEEEKELDTSKDTIMIEGSNIVFKVDAESRNNLFWLPALINSLNLTTRMLIIRKRRDD